MQKNEDKSRRAYKCLTSMVTQEMYDELIALLNGTSFQSLNELCRHIIAGKRVVAVIKDGPPDEQLADLTATYDLLQLKCSDINQLTSMIYGEKNPEVIMRLAKEVRAIFTEVTVLLERIQALVTSISIRWIPQEEPAK